MAGRLLEIPGDFLFPVQLSSVLLRKELWLRIVCGKVRNPAASEKEGVSGVEERNAVFAEKNLPFTSTPGKCSFPCSLTHKPA